MDVSVVRLNRHVIKFKFCDKTLKTLAMIQTFLFTKNYLFRYILFFSQHNLFTTDFRELKKNKFSLFAPNLHTRTRFCSASGRIFSFVRPLVIYELL